eukprot:178010_1
MSSDWTTLHKCPCYRFSNLILISNDKFVTAPYNYAHQTSEGLLSYNITINEWNTLIKYPAKFKTHNNSLSINKINQQLYLIGGSQQIQCIDLQTSSFNILGQYNTGANACSLVIQSKLHIIGGIRNNKHITYNINHNHNINDNVLKEIKDFHFWVKGNQSPGFIFVSNKQLIVLLGGYRQYHYIKVSAEIWTYNLNTPNPYWQKNVIRIPIPLMFFGCVLSADQKYIILLCGYSRIVGQQRRNPVNNIYVLDIDTMEFIQTYDIVAPVSGSVRAVIANNNDIHLFKHDDGAHWKISLTKIIPAYNINVIYGYVQENDITDEDFVQNLTSNFEQNYKTNGTSKNLKGRYNQ